MGKWFENRNNRKWVYAVSLAAIPLLVLYGVIDEAAAPLWIAVVGALVAPTLALRNLPAKESVKSGDDNG